MYSLVALLALTLIAMVVTAVRTLRFSTFPGRASYFLMMLASSWWLFCALFDVGVPVAGVKVFFSELSWFGITATPLYWMLFLRAYTRGRDILRSGLYDTLVLVTGLAVMAAALSTGVHGLIYTDVVPDTDLDGPLRLIYHRGPLFYVVTIGLYIAMLVATVDTLRMGVRSGSIHRSQFMILVMSSMVPWAANAAYVFGGMRVLGFDPTAFAFAIQPLVFNYLISRVKLFTLAPIALQAIFSAQPDAVVVVGYDGHILATNPAARRLLKLADDPVGVLFSGFCDRFVLVDDHSGNDLRCELWRLEQEYFETRIVPVYDGRRERAKAYILRNVTSFIRVQKELEVSARLMAERLDANLGLQAQLREMAVRDSLTGLYNRRVLDEMGERLLAEARNAGSPFSIITIDLDHFKYLNDTYGHKTGDDVLVMVADLLLELMGPRDVAVRMGGEEFLVMMPGTTSDEAADQAQAWRGELATRWVLASDQHVQVTMSVGVASYPAHADDFESLLQSGDRAVYAAKDAGRDCVFISGAEAIAA